VRGVTGLSPTRIALVTIHTLESHPSLTAQNPSPACSPAQPRRCHIAVVRTTTASHCRGWAALSPRGAMDARRCGRAALWPCGAREVRRSRRIAAAHGFATLASAGGDCHTRYTVGLARPRWITGPMWHWSGHDRPHVASSRLRDVRCSRWVGLKGATGSGEIGSAERAGRALAGQARGRLRAAPGSVASFTPVAEVTGTGIYQIVASPIPTCCPFPSMAISHSD